MAILANAKHELFAQKWAETENKTQSYKDSHPSCKNWKDETINVKASVLSKKDKVKARYDELKEKTAKRHGITVDTLLAELEEIKILAMTAETPQCSAAVGSVMSKAKLVGLDIVKIEVVSNELLTPWLNINSGVD